MLFFVIIFKSGLYTIIIILILFFPPARRYAAMALCTKRARTGDAKTMRAIVLLARDRVFALVLRFPGDPKRLSVSANGSHNRLRRKL